MSRDHSRKVFCVMWWMYLSCITSTKEPTPWGGDGLGCEGFALLKGSSAQRPRRFLLPCSSLSADSNQNGAVAAVWAIWDGCVCFFVVLSECLSCLWLSLLPLSRPGKPLAAPSQCLEHELTPSPHSSLSPSICVSARLSLLPSSGARNPAPVSALLLKPYDLQHSVLIAP